MDKFIQQNKNYIFAGLGVFTIYLLRKYFNGPKSKYYRDLKSNVVIVTGASEGIGKETALQLLKDNATVIFACRDEKKTLDVISRIKDDKQRSRAIFMQLDLSDFNSIKNFIQEFKSKYDQLDILVNNAAGVFKTFSKTRNGIESTLQVNTFSPMILTQGLLDLIHKSNGRVINVSALVHEKMTNTTLYTNLGPEEYFYNEKKYSGIWQYGLSKLGNVYFTRYLHKYIEKNNLNIKTASLHPGVIITELSREYKGFLMGLFYFVAFPFIWLIFKTPRMGAETTLHLCYTPEEEFKSGHYYSDSKVKALLPHANCDKNMEDFMNYSRQIIYTHGQNFDVKLEI
jgi:retinol dehydrogenase 12